MTRRSRFTDPDLQRCYDEGVQAAKERKHFKDWCPYTFDHCDKCDAYGNVVFDRQKMDEWFNGWSEQLRVEGLGYNFKPTGAGKKAP